MGSHFKTFNRLFKLKRETKYYVFDVETWGLDARPEAFALGVIYGENYTYRTTSINALRKTLLSKKFEGAVIFAHNAKYDLLTTFGNFIKTLDNETVFNGSRFIFAKKNNITFADSLNILPSSVEAIGKMTGAPKGVTPEKFKLGIRQEITEEDINYCVQDCKIVYDALADLFDEIGCVRLTLASLSMAYFRRSFLKEPLYYTPLVYEFFDSYFGGRTECFRIGKVYAQKFDINSMYPYAMKYCIFPNPNKLTRKNKPTVKEFLFYLDIYEGMAKVKIKHKETYFGYLPLKRETKDGVKLIFPVGTFTGTWNFNELRYAIEEGVVEILECEYCIYAPRMKSIFTQFVDTVYNRRIKSKDEFEKYILKLILNSLYGKFAQKQKSKAKYVEMLTTELMKANPRSIIVPFNDEREDAYIVTTEEKFSYNTIPSFSSYITSWARVYLLKQLTKYEENDICYVDTDSIACNNYAIEIETGSELGKFKMEPKIITEIFGNKSYEEKDGTKVIKGVKKGAKEIKKGTFSYSRMITPKEALRRNIPAGQFVDVTKTNTAKYDKRTVYADGTTAPIKLKE